MFESFVIGPIAGDRLGIVRQCIDCRAAAGAGARPCPGFGPGCLTTPSPPIPPAGTRRAAMRPQEAKTMRMIALAAFALAASLPCLATPDAACHAGMEMRGMHERIAALQGQMDRIESTADRSEQRRLMDLNAKMMREGMREIRTRPLGTGCRVEMMGSMMDVMIRHQQALQEPEERR